MEKDDHFSVKIPLGGKGLLVIVSCKDHIAIGGGQHRNAGFIDKLDAVMHFPFVILGAAVTVALFDDLIAGGRDGPLQGESYREGAG